MVFLQGEQQINKPFPKPNNVMHSLPHNDVMGFEVLVLHITLWKAFIVYHKSNDVTTMKKHVEIESNAHLKIP